jgi:hypothetical protein
LSTLCSTWGLRGYEARQPGNPSDFDPDDEIETLVGEAAMNVEDAVPLLEAIIAREKKDGCTMAMEEFIEPALRRWRSYERRFKRHRDKSVKHRAHDLEKGLLEWYAALGYGAFTYVPGCIRHLAQSFAEVLFQGSVDKPETSLHDKSTHS